MKRYVLDAHALLAYYGGEPGAERVASLFAKALRGDIELLVCVINWGEALYILLRERGEKQAQVFCSTLSKYPVTFVNADMTLTAQAARYKASHRISYADAFAAALATVEKAELVTGDPEFKPLEKEIGIQWISKARA